jgi:hypothetical protein
VGWRGAHGPGANEHDVRHRPKQTHDEPIRIEEPADLATARAAVDIERDDTVQRRDEVGDDGWPVAPEGDTEITGIAVTQPGRQSAAPEVPGRTGR